MVKFGIIRGNMGERELCLTGKKEKIKFSFEPYQQDIDKLYKRYLQIPALEVVLRQTELRTIELTILHKMISGREERRYFRAKIIEFNRAKAPKEKIVPFRNLLEKMACQAYVILNFSNHSAVKEIQIGSAVDRSECMVDFQIEFTDGAVIPFSCTILPRKFESKTMSFYSNFPLPEVIREFLQECFVKWMIVQNVKPHGKILKKARNVKKFTTKEPVLLSLQPQYVKDMFRT